MTRKELVEQTAYHGYTAKGTPIPKRGSLQVQPQRTSVPPASAHRTGHHSGLHPEDLPYQTADRPARNAHAYDVGMSLPPRSRYEALSLEDLLEDDEEQETTWPPRLPTSSIRYDLPPGRYIQGNTRLNVQYGAPPPQPVPPQQPPQQRQQDKRTTEERKKQGFRPHWLVFVGLAMLVMVMGWVVLTAIGNWWGVTQDDWKYGRPRTYQCDAVVGHRDSSVNPSHFIALNLNRQIEVIEFPGGDGSRARNYMVVTLVGDDQDVTPVTLSFKDVNGDGKPDMLVHIAEQTIVYLNDNGTFRPQRPGEHVTL